MRLINTSTIKLTEFFDENIPEYAILSHTWAVDEFLYGDINSGITSDRIKCGYKKVVRFCDLAKGDGYDWVWIDTCCVDKSSSAELQEAINLMYRWYQEADVCYVYLADFHLSAQNLSSPPQIADCRWFTRGWTLQELLAHDQVNFYSAEWEWIGTRRGLADHIAGFTNIRASILRNPAPGPIMACTVAERLSWAANRKTSRKEDIAYCLLGLFDINMPLLYGEGDNAFIRLQEEIIKSTNDFSIFAWKLSSTHVRSTELLFEDGLIAPSIKAFDPNTMGPVFEYSSIERASLSETGISTNYFVRDNPKLSISLTPNCIILNANLVMRATGSVWLFLGCCLEKSGQLVFLQLEKDSRDDYHRRSSTKPIALLSLEVLQPQLISELLRVQQIFVTRLSMVYDETSLRSTNRNRNVLVFLILGTDRQLSPTTHSGLYAINTPLFGGNLFLKIAIRPLRTLQSAWREYDMVIWGLIYGHIWCWVFEDSQLSESDRQRLWDKVHFQYDAPADPTSLIPNTCVDEVFFHPGFGSRFICCRFRRRHRNWRSPISKRLCSPDGAPGEEEWLAKCEAKYTVEVFEVSEEVSSEPQPSVDNAETLEIQVLQCPVPKETYFGNVTWRNPHNDKDLKDYRKIFLKPANHGIIRLN